MPPTNRRREQQLARARAVRRAQRARERARRRRLVAGILAIVVVIAGGGVGIAVAISNHGSNASATVKASTAQVACNGPKQSLAKATRSWSAEPKLTIDTKAKYTMTLDTSCGVIEIVLDAAKAPHTVNLLNFLAADHFYDGSYCHRASDSGGLTMLQCGDPTGTGSGSIGFSIAEENTKGATYPRGTLAMANTGQPHSTSNQFFLVDRDSQLPPSYTVAGHITKGLDVLDKLIAVGNDNANPAGGGTPLKRIYLEKVTVAKA